MKISEIITDKYKLRIPTTVYYDLLSDVREVEEEQEPQSFEWCDTCKEYDQENHCCHRWSKVIRNTVEEMKQGYEYEVLDKIDEIITDALDKSTDQKESQTLRWVLDKISEVTQ